MSQTAECIYFLLKYSIVTVSARRAEQIINIVSRVCEYALETKPIIGLNLSSTMNTVRTTARMIVTFARMNFIISVTDLFFMIHHFLFLYI